MLILEMKAPDGKIKATALWISRLRGCMSGSYFSSEAERLTNVSTSMTSDSEGFVFAPYGKNKSHSSMAFCRGSATAPERRSLKCSHNVASAFGFIVIRSGASACACFLGSGFYFSIGGCHFGCIRR